MAEENLNVADVTVIVSLWSLKFYDAWFQTLVKHTSAVIHGDFVQSASFETYLMALLFGKSALACVVAFFVDAYNHKYGVVLSGMVSYVLTTILAICMCLTKEIAFLWATTAASSLMFVMQPAIFGLIFNQQPNPVRRQVRRLVSLMEFAEALLLFLIGEAIPDRADESQRYSTIARWVIVIPFVTFIITIVDRIRKHVSRDRIKERGAVAIFDGIRHDVSGIPPISGLSKINILFFVLLLLPAFSLTSLESVISNLKPQNDTQFQHPSIKRIISFGQLTVIPLAEVVVSYVPMKEVLAEMSVIGLAHILNIGVVTLLVVRMNMPRSGGAGRRSEADSVHDYFTADEKLQNSADSAPKAFSSTGMTNLLDTPNLKRLSRQIQEKTFLIMLLNPTSKNVSVQDGPPSALWNGQPKELLYRLGFFAGAIQMTGSDLNVTLTFSTLPPGPQRFTKTLTFREKKVYFIIVIEDPTFDILISDDDIAYPEYVPKPILFIYNSFVGRPYWGKTLGPDHELQIKTSTGRTVFIDTLPDRSKPLQTEVPVGQLNLTLSYQGTDAFIKRRLINEGNLEMSVEPWSVNVVFVTLFDKVNRPEASYYIFTKVEFYQSRPPAPPTVPPEPEKPDAFLQTSFTMVGATLGMTSVGYIHFFWMGSPVRLRSTLYAWFLVSNQIIGWIASHIVGNEIGFGEGIGLLLMVILTGFWHFVLGWYYEYKILPDAIKRRLLQSTTTR